MSFMIDSVWVIGNQIKVRLRDVSPATEGQPKGAENGQEIVLDLSVQDLLNFDRFKRSGY